MNPHRLDSRVPFCSAKAQNEDVSVRHVWRRRQMTIILTGVVAMLLVTGASGTYLLTYQPGAKIVVLLIGGMCAGLPLLPLFVYLRRQVTTNCILEMDDTAGVIVCRGVLRGKRVDMSIPYPDVTVTLCPISVVSPRGVSLGDGWLAQMHLTPNLVVDICAQAESGSCWGYVERVFGSRFIISDVDQVMPCVG